MTTTCSALLTEEAFLVPGLVMIHTGIVAEAPALTVVAPLFTMPTKKAIVLLCKVSGAITSITFLAEEALLVPRLIVIHTGVMTEAPSLAFEASLLMHTTNVLADVPASKAKASALLPQCT